MNTLSFISMADPMTIVFGVLGVGLVILLAVAAAKRSQKLNGDSGEKNKTPTTRPSDNSYYRWQPDCQLYIKRSPEQQKIVDEYFIVKNKREYNKVLIIVGLLLAAAGILMLIIGLAGDKIAVTIFGVIAIVAGITVLIVCRVTAKPLPINIMTDEEYELAVKNKLAKLNVEQMALDRLGLDPDQVREVKPIVFSDKINTDTSLKVYNEETGRLHTSTQVVTMLFFTDEQLFAYKLLFDMCCDRKEELTDECFYSDICDITTFVNNSVIALDEKNKFPYNSMEVEILTTNSKMSFEFEVVDGTYDRSAAEMFKSRLASVDGMRQKIRERKAARI